MDEEEDYVIVVKDEEINSKELETSFTRAKNIVKGVYKATALIGDISHLYGLVYFLFHLYRNPATYAAISMVGHGPFLIFYVSFLKLRGWF